MEPEDSLPHLQVPTTCPFPEPDQSSLCPRPPTPVTSSLLGPKILISALFLSNNLKDKTFCTG